VRRLSRYALSALEHSERRLELARTQLRQAEAAYGSCRAAEKALLQVERDTVR
jgi:hypothetical protein